MTPGRGRRAGRVAALVVALVALHFALRPWLVGWPIAPDLLAAGLLVAALRTRPAGSAAIGCALGLLEGSMALEGLGSSMIAYTVVGYAASSSRGLLFTDAWIFVPAYLFVGTWILQVTALVLSTAPVGGSEAWLAAPVSAALTAAVGWAGLRSVTRRPY